MLVEDLLILGMEIGLTLTNHIRMCMTKTLSINRQPHEVKFMNITVHQSIHINLLTVGVITNACALLIGRTGAIQAQSDLYDAGGDPEPAEEADPFRQSQPIVPLSQ